MSGIVSLVVHCIAFVLETIAYVLRWSAGVAYDACDTDDDGAVSFYELFIATALVVAAIGFAYYWGRRTLQDLKKQLTDEQATRGDQSDAHKRKIAEVELLRKGSHDRHKKEIVYPWHFCRIKKRDGTWFRFKTFHRCKTPYFAHLDTGNSAPTTITRALYDALKGDADMQEIGYHRTTGVHGAAVQCTKIKMTYQLSGVPAVFCVEALVLDPRPGAQTLREYDLLISSRDIATTGWPVQCRVQDGSTRPYYEKDDLAMTYPSNWGRIPSNVVSKWKSK